MASLSRLTPPGKLGARVGYQVAASLWAYEGQVVWATFNAMLVANSIILAAEGFFPKAGLAHIALPILEVILCLVWYAMNVRAFEIHNYRILSAREIEELYLSDVVKTVSRGATFHAGQAVNLTMGKREIVMRMPIIGRLFRSQSLATIVIVAFGILHLLSLIL